MKSTMTYKRKIVLGVVAGVLLACLWNVSLQASASTRYNAFGNNVVGDCLYAAEANLVMHEYPNAVITTAQVEAASVANGQDGFINYFETTGYGGYTIAGISPTPLFTISEWNNAAHTSGVMAIMHLTPASYGGTKPANHAYAVIGMDTRYVEVVSWGKVLRIPRPLFLHEVIFAFALQWPAPSVPPTTVPASN